jgi:uncharacterized protein DUF6544
MRWLAGAFLAVHGLIHLMGFAKGFGMALVWLVAALVMLATAVMLLIGARGWWLVGACALMLSQAVIVSSWRDAWAGTIANVVLLVAVVYGSGTEGPWSFRARFERDVAQRLGQPIEMPVVTEHDVAHLPEPVKRYLRAAGVVGRPRVVNYQVHFTGRIRSGPDTPWMPFEARQQSFAERPGRFFLMHARMYGLPVEAFHRLTDGHAAMQVKLAGTIPIADARGDAMDRSEAVTLFNDMCILAPATLIDRHIEWESVDGRTARARFRNGAHTISATLFFAEDGVLSNFVSDDRSRASSDGRTFTRLRFSTPVASYRNFGPARLATHGEARWTLPEGEFTYGEFDLQQVAYNVQR